MQRLSLSRRTAQTGTYVAEHYGNNSFNLLAAPLAHKAVSACNAPLSARGLEHRRRKIPGIPKGLRLTALDCLEPILSSEPVVPHLSSIWSEEKSSSKLVQDSMWLSETDGSQMPHTARTSTVSSRRSSRCARRSMEPTDEEFKNYLTSSSIGWVDGSSLDTTSADVGTDRSAWRILLLEETFEDCSNTWGHVSKCLMDILGLPSTEAHQKASAARYHAKTALRICTNKKDASKKVQALRKHGLVVQVVSVEAREAAEEVERKALEARASPARGSARKSSNYVDFFQQVAYGESGMPMSGRRSCGPILVSPAGLRPASKEASRRSSLPLQVVAANALGRDRRRASAQAALEMKPAEVIPADPVEALFKDEIEHCAERHSLPPPQATVTRSHTLSPLLQEDQPPPNASAADTSPASPASPVSPSRFGELLRKHACKGTLQQSLPAVNKLLLHMQKDPTDHCKESLSAFATGNVWSGLFDQLDSARTKTAPASPAKKEAFQLFRFFVFGLDGYEQPTTLQELDAMCNEGIGPLEQVVALQNLWQRLDADNSGRVDITEFRVFATEHMKNMLQAGVPAAPSQHHMPDIWHGVRESGGDERKVMIARLCTKVEQQLLGKKSSFTIEDMMRLLWLRAQPSDLKIMKASCQEVIDEAARARVEIPPPLSPQDFEDLCTVFKHYDDAGSGEILFEDLVVKGLIYKDQIETCKKEWDSDGNGKLGMLEFCEMMCPVGYRASEQSQIGTQKDGTRVVFDNQINGWRLEKMESVQREAQPEAAVEA